MGGMQMKEIPAPDKLPPPLKMTGIGNSHITITATPDAQAWFDQGLSLLHDFWDYESERAFEQSIRVDPQCAMCFWGLEQALLFRHNEGSAYSHEALASAVKLKSRASRQEQLYIEAAVAANDASAVTLANSSANNEKEVGVLRQLVKDYPNDTQAKIFLSSALRDGFTDAGEPKKGTQESIAILQEVLKKTPDDSAANHYWIHAVEAGAHPEQALKSSAILASLAPASGHMVHMPGHIYYRVGNYPEAERWFTASMLADEKYMREQHVGPDDDWNYAHNMMYAIANLMEQGRLKDANGLSDHLSAARGRLSSSLYIWSARDQMARLSYRLPVALRIGDWDAVLTMLGQANVDAGQAVNLHALTAELTDYAQGMKALENDDVAAAEAASERMDAGLWRVQQRQKEEAADKAKEKQEAKGKPDTKDESPKVPVNPDALSEPLMKDLAIQSLELRAGILAGKGKLEEAKKMYAEAAREEKKLGYHEPPMYIRPVGETEAAALMKAKDYEGAKAAFEAALKERPDSGFGLYGLARVKELSGDSAGARQAYGAFLKAWPAADAALPEITHARKVVSAQSIAER
jgi:tetratricopeptide (TPR) repeat protein